VRAGALTFAAWLGLNGADATAVRPRAADAVELSRPRSDFVILGVAQTVLGLADLRADRFETAYPYLENAVAAYAAIDHPWGAAMGSVIRSRMAFHQGDLALAGEAARDAVDGFRRVGTTAPSWWPSTRRGRCSKRRAA
jgi:hypothetical protein